MLALVGEELADDDNEELCARVQLAVWLTVSDFFGILMTPSIVRPCCPCEKVTNRRGTTGAERLRRKDHGARRDGDENERNDENKTRRDRRLTDSFGGCSVA